MTVPFPSTQTPPRVVSVNIGRPQNVEWQGTAVRTAFFKCAVDGRIPIIGNNLEGDGQADLEVHGGTNKTLFVYSHEHYDFWREWLGIEDLPFGMFGENLTTSGVVEDNVAIGDRFRIGDAELVVTEPRQPCYKVDVRFGRVGGAREMVRTGRVGFYLGLVSPGAIARGDVLEFLGGPTGDRVSPADLHRLNTSATFDDIERLERVACLPEVQPWWADMLQVKASGLRRARSRKKQPWVGKREFVVGARVVEADGVDSIHLTSASDGSVPAVVPGQFITISMPSRDGGRPIDRSYTVSGAGDRSLRITVRRSPTSEGGSERVHQLQVGDLVGLCPPAGDFTLEEHPPDAPFVILSAGIGITPSVAFARAIAARPGAEVVAVHAMRSADDDALVNELARSIAQCDRGRFFTFIEDGSSSRHLDLLDQHPGRPTVDSLREMLSGVVVERAQAYMCGPPGFMTAVREILVELGMPQGAIHTEEFRSPSTDELPVDVPVGGLEVMFAQRASTMLWADSDVSLLDLAEEAGVSIPASCRQGVCGTCITPVLDGEVAYKRVPAAPVGEGMCLPCIAVPKSRLLLDA